MLIGDVVARFVMDTGSFDQSLFKSKEAYDAFIEGIKKGANDASNGFNKVQQEASQTSSTLQTLATAVAAYFSINAIINYVNHLSSMGHEVTVLAQQMHMTIAETEGLRIEAEKYGNTVSQVGFSMRMLIRQLEEGAATTPKVAAALKELKISPQDIAAVGDEPARVMELLGQKLEENVKGYGQQVKVLGDLGGRYISQLLPLILAQADGVREVDQATAHAIERWGEFHKVIKETEAAMLHWAERTSVSLIDTLIEVGKIYGDIWQWIKDHPFQISWGGAFGTGILGQLLGQGQPEKGGEGFTAFVQRMQKERADTLQHHEEVQPKTTPYTGPTNAQIKAFDTWAKTMETSTVALHAHGLELDAVARETDTGREAAERYKVTQDAIAKGINVNSDAAKKLIDNHMAEWRAVENLTDEEKRAVAVRTEMAKAAEFEAKVEKTLKDQMIEAIKVQADWSNATVKATEDAMAAYSQLNDQVKQFAINAMPEGATRNIAQATIEYDKLRNSLIMVAVNYADLPGIIDKVGEAVAALDKAQAKTIERMDPVTKEWEGMFDSITSGIDSTVQGVLQGTQTMADAFKNMGRNIVISLITEFNKLAIINPLKNLLFNQDNPTAAGMFGGLFGWLFGGGTTPVAAGPSAIAGDVPFAHAQEGGSVARTGMAIIHQGETIIPAGQAKTGTTSPNVTVQINGDITPRQPTMRKEDVVKIVMADMDERGPIMQMLELRGSRS